MSDPCVEAARLRELYTAMISGQQVTEARFGEDFRRWGKGDAGALLTEIQRLERQCSALSGTATKRTGRAISGRYRLPY